jgi:tetratricopeptide (TPR) repeat protein
LAWYYSEAGRLQDALALREEVLRLRRMKFGEEHPDTLKAANALAISYGGLGQIQAAVDLLRSFACKSADARDAVCYNLSCYECLSGDVELAKELISEHLTRHPENKKQALDDADLVSIKDFIATL